MRNIEKYNFIFYLCGGVGLRALENQNFVLGISLELSWKFFENLYEPCDVINTCNCYMTTKNYYYWFLRKEKSKLDNLATVFCVNCVSIDV